MDIFSIDKSYNFSYYVLTRTRVTEICRMGGCTLAKEDAEKVVRRMSDRSTLLTTLRRAVDPKHGGSCRDALRQHPRCLARALRTIDTFRGEYVVEAHRLVADLLPQLKFDPSSSEAFIGEVVEWQRRADRVHPVFMTGNLSLADCLMELGEKVGRSASLYVTHCLFCRSDAVESIARNLKWGRQVELCRKVFSRGCRSLLANGLKVQLIYDPEPFVIPSKHTLTPRSVWDDPRYVPLREISIETVEFVIKGDVAVFDTLSDYLGTVIEEDRFPEVALQQIVGPPLLELDRAVAWRINHLGELAESGELKRWVPPGKLWHFKPRIAGCSAREMGIVDVAVSCGSTHPSLEFEVITERFGHVHTESWAVAPGQIFFETEMNEPQERFRLFLSAMVLDCVGRWATEETKPSTNGGRKASGSGAVPPGAAYMRFVKLPRNPDGTLKVRKTDGKPYQASDKAKERAAKHMEGKKPSVGQTFRMVPSPDEGSPRPVTVMITDEGLFE